MLKFVVLGNSAQMNDKAFVAELKSWIRFSGCDAVRRGDGLYAASSGNPALPDRLGRMLFDLIFTPKAEKDKYARQVHLNMPVEVASLRPPFAGAIGIANKRPDLVIRFGRGPKLPPSSRRPPPAVLV
jgi:hypothetical protein